MTAPTSGEGGPAIQLERFRKFNTRDVYPDRSLDNDMCMVVKAGRRIFLRGQTGLDLDQRLVHPDDAGAQADQLDGTAGMYHEDRASTYDGV